MARTGVVEENQVHSRGNNGRILVRTLLFSLVTTAVSPELCCTRERLGMFHILLCSLRYLAPNGTRLYPQFCSGLQTGGVTPVRRD